MSRSEQLPLTFWTLSNGVVSATRGGIRYRAKRTGSIWICTVVRGNSPPLSQGMAANVDAAQSWLATVATEIEQGRRPAHRRHRARAIR